MKKRYIFLFVFNVVFLSVFAQPVIMTTLKIGEIKLGFSVDSVNKYLEKKIAIKPYKQIKEDSEYSKYDTVFINYKSSKIRLVFNNYFDSYDSKKQFIVLQSLYSEDKNLITKSGIKIGDNKFDIIKKLDGSTLLVSPENGKEKMFSVVTLMDYTNYNQISFYFKNNVLYAMECTGLSEEEGC
jgi:hypothetical protein